MPILTDNAQRDVSVVIPSYNRRGLIGQALDSVLNQTHPPMQIIVVDDGSTDDTSSFVAASYPSVDLIVQNNRGVSAARNTGIVACRGTWVAFLDSDDSWLPTKLDRQLDIMAENPEHRLCHTEEIWIRNGRRVNQMKKHKKSGGWIFERCLALCCISPSSALIRRDVFDDIGMFDESLPACEDYDFWLRITAKEPVVFVDEPLITKYGGHDDQLSRRFEAMDRFRLKSLSKLVKMMDVRQEYRSMVEDEMRRRLQILITGATKRGNQTWKRQFEKELSHLDNPQ